MRLAVLFGLVGWIGTTLLLAELRWFRRRPLADRLLPYSFGADDADVARHGVLSVSSVRDVLGPIATALGEQIGRITGIDEPIATRLSRVHDEVDTTTFRLRQLGQAAVGGVAGGAFAGLVSLPPLAGLAAMVAGGTLGFLVAEQRLAARSATWQQRVFLELPIVAEQLGMLLSAGYSLGAAISRLAGRGAGAAGQDLRRVVSRIQHGLTEAEALREWAALVDVDAVDRLVAVLALNREAGDLGRLISEEARVIRREVQRQLVETIERRAQQVWIPVTVAALLPGVLFLAVPFIEALKVFSGG